MKLVIENDLAKIHELETQNQLIEKTDYIYPNKLTDGELFYLVEINGFNFGLLANDYGTPIKISEIKQDKYLIIESDTFYLIDSDKQDIFHYTSDEIIIDVILLENETIIINDISVACYENDDFSLLWRLELALLVTEYEHDDFLLTLTLADSDEKVIIDLLSGNILTEFN